MTVELADDTQLRSRYLVGCDGGRSTVRKLLGVGFGEAATVEWLLGEMELTAPPEELAAVVAEVRKTQKGSAPGPWGTGCTASSCLPGVAEDRTVPPTLEEVKQRLRAVAGTDRGALTALARFGDATRLAERYRVGRVLLAGDAAHIHTAAGRAGAQPRHPGRVQPGLETGRRGRRLGAGGAAGQPAGGTRWPPTCWTTPRAGRADVLEPVPRRCWLVSELMDFEEVNRYLIEKITAIGCRAGEGHELLGRRLRDVELKRGASTG